MSLASYAPRLKLIIIVKRGVALYATALLAGLRRGELRALRVSDVHGLEADTGERWIGVERSWDDRDGLVDPKSKAGMRSTLLCETLRAILAEHVRQTGRSGDDLIFGKTASVPFVPWTIAKHADDAWDAAELPRVTLHRCRHGFDSFLDAAGTSETAQTATWATPERPWVIATGTVSAANLPRMPRGSRTTSAARPLRASRCRLARKLAHPGWKPHR
jgi:integrase